VLRAQLVLDLRQRFGDRPQQQAFRRAIAVRRRAHEIVAAGVLDVLGHVRHQAADVDQVRRGGGLRRRQGGRLLLGMGVAGDAEGDEQAEQEQGTAGRGHHQWQSPLRWKSRSS
jgi:hypothetical protein